MSVDRPYQRGRGAEMAARGCAQSLDSHGVPARGARPGWAEPLHHFLPSLADDGVATLGSSNHRGSQTRSGRRGRRVLCTGAQGRLAVPPLSHLPRKAGRAQAGWGSGSEPEGGRQPPEGLARLADAKIALPAPPSLAGVCRSFSLLLLLARWTDGRHLWEGQLWSWGGLFSKCQD